MDFDPTDTEIPPISVATVIPLPPRILTFAPRSVSMSAARRSLSLVSTNPTPAQTSVTVPALRLVPKIPKHDAPPSIPPPSIPPTGSTPIRRAA